MTVVYRYGARPPTDGLAVDFVEVTRRNGREPDAAVPPLPEPGHAARCTDQDRCAARNILRLGVTRASSPAVAV